jgi:outer membrane protein assembly factor BamB
MQPEHNKRAQNNKEKKNLNKKHGITAVLALVILLSADITFSALPTNAQTPSTMATYCFVGAVPNPAGVGERVFVHYGITQGLSTASGSYTGLTVVVTDPSGQNTTLGPLTTDSTGGSYTYYTPTTTGTYYLQAFFPEQPLPEDVSRNGLPKGTIMLASSSDVLTLNVTDEPTPQYPGNPLPTEYWSNPIDAQLQNWYSISGNWLETPYHFYAPYNEYAPQTSHILWSKELTTGGLVGGLLGDAPVSMETGDAYEGFFAGSRTTGSTAVIMNGKLFYNDYSYRAAYTDVPQNIVCVDLKTGETLWNQNLNNTRLEFGQTYYWNSYNYQGTYAFLWTLSDGGTTWNGYEPSTGKWLYSMTNMPSSTAATRLRGDNGEIIIYHFDLANGWMMKWNSSYLINPDGGSFSRNAFGKVYDCSMVGYQSLPNQGGWMWNKTIPVMTGVNRQSPIFLDDSFYLTSNNIGANTIVDSAFTGAPVTASATSPTTTTVIGISLKPESEGTMLYNVTWNDPAEWLTQNATVGWRDASLTDNIAVLFTKELRQYYGISLSTGKIVWGPTASTDSYLDHLQASALTANAIVDGRLYGAGVGGIVYCYNVTNGNLIWKYTAEDPYLSTGISSNWWVGIQFITAGMIYLGHGEHSPNMPLPPRAPYICLNATTGDLIWRIDGGFQETVWGGNSIIGGSTIVTQDQYTQNIYAIGKGPSATTINTPDSGITLGSFITIKGTVNDISPGTSTDFMKMRFPNGVPAVSDASMSAWMLYVYKQFAQPTNTTGVTVVLSVMDSNGNFRDIGTTTTDANGFYSYQWQPDIPGKYTIYARFAGTQSYYGSYAESAFNVEEAPAPTTQPTPLQSLTDQYFLPAVAGIIAAIFIVGAILMMLVRKRP